MTGKQAYAALDQPFVTQFLFHPRREGAYRIPDGARSDLLIPVGTDVSVGASLHLSDTSAPVILFFHGNGEIVSDYDDLGKMFTDLGLNFFVADYRGYGSSTGSPTVSAMMADCHVIQRFLDAHMAENGMAGPVFIMGRSLGSASALELAANSSLGCAGLIIESGFAYAAPLLRVLGLDPAAIGFREENGFENIDKMGRISAPCLVIHAEYDHIIPFSDGRALYDACPSENKELLEIKGANHNDIFLRGAAPYLAAMKKICGI